MRYRSTFFTDNIDLPIKVSYCQVHHEDQAVDFDVLTRNLEALRLDIKSSEYLLILHESNSQIVELKTLFELQIKRGLLKLVSYKHVNDSRLLNLAFGLAKGAAVMNLVPGDSLAPRMTAYIFSELKVNEEAAFLFEKKHTIPHRIAVWRNTFYEIGGFDERQKHQTRNLADRLDLIGVYVTRKVHDHLTQTKQKRERSFRLLKSKPEMNIEFVRPCEKEYTWLV